MELNDNILQLITRQLNNEASPQEVEELNVWLDENPAHRQEYEAYVKIWNESSSVLVRHDFNTSAGWERLQTRMASPADYFPTRKGRIVLFRRLAVAAAIIFIVGLSVFYFYNNSKTSWQTFAAAEGNRRISLPDGTVVLLRKGSTLRKSDTYGKEERMTELQGEAFFEVKRDEQKPFRIFTKDAVVEVLGTSFLVRNSDSLDMVIVKSGTVRFADRQISRKAEVILTRGQEARLKNGKLIQDIVTDTNYLSWESGKLVFSNTPLQLALQDISNLYGIRIEIDPEAMTQATQITIQAEFDNQSLEQVLDEIQLMTGLKATRSKEKITFHH